MSGSCMNSLSPCSLCGCFLLCCGAHCDFREVLSFNTGAIHRTTRKWTTSPLALNCQCVPRAPLGEGEGLLSVTDSDPLFYMLPKLSHRPWRFPSCGGRKWARSVSESGSSQISTCGKSNAPPRFMTAQHLWLLSTPEEAEGDLI